MRTSFQNYAKTNMREDLDCSQKVILETLETVSRNLWNTLIPQVYVLISILLFLLQVMQVEKERYRHAVEEKKRMSSAISDQSLKEEEVHTN